MDIFNGLTLKQISLMTPEHFASVSRDVFYKDVKAWSDKYFEENLEYINSQHELISCLYDVNLLPEQILSYFSVKEDTDDILKGRSDLKRLMFIVDLWRNQKGK